MQQAPSIGLRDVQAVYSGPEGEMVFMQQLAQAGKLVQGRFVAHKTKPA